MFVAKLFIVLLIVNASVCSKHKRQSSVEAEYVDPVVVELHGPDFNEECPPFSHRFLDERCPVSNFPSIERITSPRVRNDDDFLQLVRETPLEDFCRDLSAGYTCVKETILTIPKQCRSRMLNQYVAMCNAILTATDYLCEEEIENIRTHINCFTTKELYMAANRCLRLPFQQQCDEDQVIECISRAIDQTSSCQEGAKKVFERIAFRLAEDIKPCAMLEELMSPHMAAIFKFFK